ncbi:S8 family serine peptidase [Chitinimonas sp.]|uniref:S8 family serine peptidase n=1 Tax=Chitinimonas sp. TaxID=1934313 RepID=UPI002F91EE5F
MNQPVRHTVVTRQKLQLQTLLKGGFTASALVAVAVLAPKALAGEPTEYAPGRILVQFKPGLASAEQDKILKNNGGRKLRSIAGINVHVIDLGRTGSEKSTAALLKHNPNIKFAEVDARVPHGGATNDTYYASSWHLAKIGASSAWDTATGNGVTIAILDSGVDGTHPDLAAQMVPGWNMINNNSDTADVNGHGTAVAGAAAATANNAAGVAGVAYGAKIMPVRIADANAYAYWSDVANGLTWAADHGAKVANISYVGVSGSAAVQSAAQYLRNKGGETVVCAGNNNIDEGIAPSDTMISVAATDANDAKTSFSSYGSFVDIAAPGINIWTTQRGGTYGQWWGTSIASPITAGVVAAMMSAKPGISPAQLENLLFSTAQDLGTAGKDVYFGWGRVNAAAAVTAAKNAVITDTQAPTVAITSPGGGTVKGMVTVNVNASDNTAVSRVDLYIGGALLASDISTPYSFAWDSSKSPDGAVNLQAKAYDAAGNVASSSVNVTVSNTVDTVAPSVTISNPVNGSLVNNNVTITANGSDNIGVVQVDIYVDGALKASAAGSSASYTWNARKASSGAHSIQAVARDAAGNTSTSTVNVTH